tara:strand:+ start:545 stop:703 length:159 start_codon:yes stop_codon:yes gene_type:complete
MNLENKKEALVLHHFLNDQNNTAPAIASLLEIKRSRVDRIITKYLDQKTINE